jgi:hypothetical protein
MPGIKEKEKSAQAIGVTDECPRLVQGDPEKRPSRSLKEKGSFEPLCYSRTMEKGENEGE